MPPDRKVFIAGSTGAVGRTVTRLALEQGVPFVAHQRPAPDRPGGSNAAQFPLTDSDAITEALRSCTTVVQLIGTMRNRFARGDTYQTSDIGTTRQLVDAARRAGTIDHLVLLSSVGAGRPLGAYLKAKAEAERLVRQSGIPFTVFRPSAFMGEGHEIPGFAERLTRALGLKRYQPIKVEDLARSIVHVSRLQSELGATLEGDTLWRVVEAARPR